MGYFTSLIRHTGISVGSVVSRPAPVVSGIEMDETRGAEPPSVEARSHPLPPTVEPHRDLPSIQLPAPRFAATEPPAHPVAAPATPQDTTASPAPGEIFEAISAPPRTEIREYTVEVEKQTLEVVASNEIVLPTRPHRVTATEIQPVPEIPVVRVGKREAPRPPHEKELPTLADVRAWVAQPQLQIGEALAPESMPSRPPAVTRVVEAPTLAIDRRENYSLEIGTIQILIDGPAAAAPQRPAPPDRPSEPAKSSWSRPSRHYLRS